PQVQIWDDPVGSGGIYNNQKNPSKPIKRADNPPGTWNRFRILLLGERVTVYLNEELVVNNVLMENYWERGLPLYPMGAIELQHHQSPLYFKNIFVQPASGDSGSALGAAALAHIKLTGKRHTEVRIPHVFLGPGYESESISDLITQSGIKALDFRGKEAELLEAIVDRLNEQKVIGWFHGRMEFGPRALGARSIIADPRDVTMRDRLNALVKKREGFRPFAPVILEAHMNEHMDMTVSLLLFFLF
ncbi:MAG: DUF1080 domain-containing protein, partial [Pedobacter sp.]